MTCKYRSSFAIISNIQNKNFPFVCFLIRKNLSSVKFEKNSCLIIPPNPSIVITECYYQIYLYIYAYNPQNTVTNDFHTSINFNVSI